MRLDKITFIRGTNFSGRSHYLRTLTSQPGYEQSNHLYAGPIPQHYLSGITSSVDEEIALYGYSSSPYQREIEQLFELLDMNRIRKKNPFSLSGGEMSILNFMITFLSRNPFVCLDTVSEQIYNNTLKDIFRFISREEWLGSYILADNRISEYQNIQVLDVPANATPEIIKNRLPFKEMAPVPVEMREIDAHTLALKGINFSYKHDKVLTDVNCEMHSGRLYHLKGANGAGKSTLSKILAGILKPDSGVIEVHGKEISLFGAPGKTCTYHFQNPDDQLFSASISEEILPAFLFRSHQKRMPDVLQMLLQSFGLTEVKERHPFDMPLTIRKRIALASCFASNSPWLILDEPTLYLDDTSLEVLKFLISLKIKNGYGIILISHSDWFKEAFEYSTLFLKDGKLE